MTDVPVERERLVLGRDEDVAQAGVDAITENEIDDAVRTAEEDRRLPLPDRFTSFLCAPASPSLSADRKSKGAA
ncbi:MAG: hypothetical protein LC791_04515 [Acidobacteria bacterium]|nr:hypothetical protein [Acidobacteriota bacterium]